MSPIQIDKYDYAENGKEIPDAQNIERVRTVGGHIDDRGQPSLPVVHRTFANPAPLGCVSFGTGVFLLSLLGLHARGIQENNVILGVLMFFGGLCQFISGIMEFMTGNTVCHNLNIKFRLPILFSLVQPSFRLTAP